MVQRADASHRLSQRTARTIFVVLILLLLAGTTMPKELKTSIEGRMWFDLPWSALAHYTLFTLIGLCPVYGAGRSVVWRIALVAVVLAVTTEFLQSFVPGRHPRLQDALVDWSGTTTAILLLRLMPEMKRARG